MSLRSYSVEESSRTTKISLKIIKIIKKKLNIVVKYNNLKYILYLLVMYGHLTRIVTCILAISLSTTTTRSTVRTFVTLFSFIFNYYPLEVIKYFLI